MARFALFATLLLFWLNFLLTSRWGHIPGALNGPRRPLVMLALLAVTIAALFARRMGPVSVAREARLAAWCGLAAIGVLFFVWFPPSVWTEIPLPDNWPARFQSTVDGQALLGHGTLVGWQWQYLGGYATSSDLTVTLTVPALIPMLILGDRVGFHLAHLVLFIALPLLVYWDFRIEQRSIRDGSASDAPELPWLVLALTSATTLGYSYVFLRSGDTNSLTGVAATLVALIGSHLSTAGNRWGTTVLMAGLTLVVYSHTGFLVYAALLLAAEAAFYLDAARARRLVVALVAASLAGLPLTWESWRYPAYFAFNNVVFDLNKPVDWIAAVHQVYYNVEMLVQPGRWVNDFTGLAMVCLPLAVVVAFRRTRAGFYAAATLLVVAITRFNVPEIAGYAFIRPIHLLGVLTPPVLAAFILRYGTHKALAVTLAALVPVYVQVLVRPVPHAPDVAAYQPDLVERLRTLDGALVLVENTFHRDMVEGPGESDPTPFISHFQSLLGAETGKRLYAGIWDGWQWSPARGQLLAGGAWMGRALEDWPRDRFLLELRRWGIRHLLVIHERTRRYLAGPEFQRRAEAGPYGHFELIDADDRAVATTTGTGVLSAFDPLGATVELQNVRRGSLVVVRTNYHPAWTAEAGGTSVPLLAEKGQLAFAAPSDGSYVVTLHYPRRWWLWIVAVTGFAAGVGILGRMRR
jgi:hypothetical protein